MITLGSNGCTDTLSTVRKRRQQPSISVFSSSCSHTDLFKYISFNFIFIFYFIFCTFFSAIVLYGSVGVNCYGQVTWLFTQTHITVVLLNNSKFARTAQSHSQCHGWPWYSLWWFVMLLLGTSQIQKTINLREWAIFSAFAVFPGGWLDIFFSYWDWITQLSAWEERC